MNRFAKQLFVIVSITLLGCIYIQYNNFFSPLHLRLQPDYVTIDYEDDSPTCRPQSKIVFLKAHKCASSTIQNIFMRYGYFNDKLFVLPASGNYLGHPAPFNRTMVPDASTFGGNFSILTHHSRFSYDEMRRTIPGAIFVTIIRRPANLFESMFHYYKLKLKWNFDFAQLNNVSFELPANVSVNRFMHRIGVNQMSFDLGLEPEYFDDDERIAQHIARIDSIFALVMVAERMDESLILLKELLCWDYEDVVAFKINARNIRAPNRTTSIFTTTMTSTSPTEPTDMSEAIRKILALNRADVALYEHFARKLDRAIDAFGRARMQRSVARLRRKRNFYYRYCVGDVVVHNHTHVMQFVNRKRYNPTCKFLTGSEIALTNFIRNEQAKRYPGSVFNRTTL